MGGDGLQAPRNEQVVAGRRAGQSAAAKPDRRPGEGINDHTPVAMEGTRWKRLVEALLNALQEWLERFSVLRP